MNQVIRAAASIGLLAASVVSAQGTGSCGPLQGMHYGPYDYRKERAGKLAIVETAHFTPIVEALIKGSSSDFVGDDLSYTLRAAPNHHRALLAVVRFAERTKSVQPPYMQYSVDCYFDRAIRFQPDDTVVRALFAQYLNRRGRTAEGLTHLNAAVVFAKDNPLSHYNLGLVYLELNAHDEALKQAHTAIALGMPPGTLVDQLKALGKWREASPTPEAEAASAPEGGASTAR